MGLSKRTFDPQIFTAQTECSICLENFDADCEVTPLSCDVRHYYHTPCIEEWIKDHN